ncbi:UDP-N-acetylglucosamine 4,6-dehydratase [Dyadobacter luticola]|uniref:Polysaccharide biosynthesis protein n=1 Tax=Dyadobacter luticola TaxID=1979387 RepID=A0A5R9KUX7_9BACT|nr:polysaccharide biosynthesis protein [Dyadobacter luticola]TLV00034.1 polysaccharide biosynthesis protein [Dyadobacter luticola]
MKSVNQSLQNFKCNPEDLLDRQPIVLDQHNIAQEIRGSIILITGAAGSIGSELALQICRHKPQALILLDQSETGLNDLDMNIREKFPNVNLQSYIANITDEQRMRQVFSDKNIQIVFHAAAYKHVPVMENHPYEAIKTNIFGTEILASVSLENHVRKFLFVSTDKAVNPASIMGATKRFAEILLQHYSHISPGKTKFIITRFGNVLGSNGSFLHTFERQIRSGGPVTVTHPEVQRYLMTVTEACQLVLEATAISEGNEILFFDMGKPVYIRHIADRMIRLAGLQPGKDIYIKYIGLRPGEKIREEIGDANICNFCKHSKMRATAFSDNSQVCANHMMFLLQEALASGDDKKMVSVLRKAIPEYQSEILKPEIHSIDVPKNQTT